MRGVTVHGVETPALLYGTAWKEERTRPLVEAALAAGFGGIDTANQRKHYHEAAVGEALSAMAGHGIGRDALFLQSKFTYVEGQDTRLPYDPEADLPTQVRQSLASSLEHLRTDRLDSFLLHGPRASRGLSRDDIEVWRTMEDLQREGRTRLVGVSNVTAGQLAALCELAEVRPAFAQNRCFARLGWDREARAVCRAEGVVYQGFSLLTANRRELGSAPVRRVAAELGRTPEQVVFRLALQLGMVCLTGTTNPRHMREDVEVHDFALSAEQVAELESLSG